MAEPLKSRVQEDLMKRWITMLAAVAPLVAVQPASAWERGPVCREPSVIDEMTREIRARNYYTQVDPGLVTEQATSIVNVVRCQVCVLAAPYESTQFGDRPVRHCLAHAFEVRIVPAGFVVRDLQ
jgi:hypothetical protein